MTTEDHDILVRLDEKVEAMHRELIVGNGGPSLKERVDSLEESRTQAKGWAAGVSAAAVAGWTMLEWLFHRGGGK